AWQQSTGVAMGPTESKLQDSGRTPSSGIRHREGLKPTSPQSAAGIRTEPAVSEPMATVAMPAATDTAAPEEEPPGMRLRSWGLPGVPWWRLLPTPEKA